MDKAGKNILILSASARIGGNTDLLCDEFIRGAKAAGHHTEKLYIGFMHIGGCKGCRVCQKNVGQCVQRDDMTTIYSKILASDVIVWASPVYFYSFNAQMKAVMDRTFAIEPILKEKTAYLIATGAAPDAQYMSVMIESFHRYLSCFDHIKEGGLVLGTGMQQKGDIMKSPSWKEAYEMGLQI